MLAAKKLDQFEQDSSETGKFFVAELRSFTEKKLQIDQWIENEEKFRLFQRSPRFHRSCLPLEKYVSIFSTDEISFRQRSSRLGRFHEMEAHFRSMIRGGKTFQRFLRISGGNAAKNSGNSRILVEKSSKNWQKLKFILSRGPRIRHSSDFILPETESTVLIFQRSKISVNLRKTYAEIISRPKCFPFSLHFSPPPSALPFPIKRYRTRKNTSKW